jgi:hypothetical protein
VSSQVPSCILFGALMTLVHHQDRSNTQDSVVHFCMILMRSQPQLCVSILFHHPKRISSSIAPMIDPIWNLRKSLTLELEKVLFHFEHPLESLEQEDRVMNPKTSKVMKRNLILQGLCPSRMKGKVASMTEKSSSFQLSR